MSVWGIAIAGVGGALIGAVGANAAASTQAGAAENAQQISQNEFNTITAQETPYMQSGYGALSALDWGLGIAPQAAGGGTPEYPAGPSPVSPYGSSFYGGGGGSFYGGGPVNPRGLGPGSMAGMMTSDGVPQMLPGGSFGGPRPGPVGRPGTPGYGAQTPANTGAGPAGLGFGSLTAPFTVANWQQLSPAYNFVKQQGQQGVLNQDASSQGALSGSAMKDLLNYNQSAALGSFNDAFNMYQTQQGNIFNRLAGIAQLGQSAAANTGQQGTALAGQAAQSAQNIGNAYAGGIVGATNSITGSLPWLYAANAKTQPVPTGSGYDGSVDTGDW